MKYIKVIVYFILLFIYVYSCYRTTNTPDNNIWGYICAGLFGVLFLWMVSYFTENIGKKSEEE
jgi:hypothetical protein